ncbi:hypothetical protein KPL37_01995 [Clostridium frigoris]|uniref:Uncharacterized protein n=1 Tax=Clostridium frigoris TaxID=205327 RepID=A0ABS6BNP6_9CLOT|nr:hypothetical protein [Clostridium frigoris]MBU3158543.1 hypothetical protein [Clostridium frigoris]
MKSLIDNVKNKNIGYSEEAITSTTNNIQQDFKINIHNGKGFFETGINNSFWSSLIITAKIFQPQNGAFDIVIRDKAKRNLIVYENHNMVHDKEISFKYKTGLKVNLLIEAIWTQPKDTTLCGEISINY